MRILSKNEGKGKLNSNPAFASYLPRGMWLLISLGFSSISGQTEEVLASYWKPYCLMKRRRKLTLSKMKTWPFRSIIINTAAAEMVNTERQARELGVFRLWWVIEVVSVGKRAGRCFWDSIASVVAGT